MNLKHVVAAAALVLTSTLASAQQVQQVPRPEPLPAAPNWALVVTGIFGASFYFYLECLTGNCRPVPCWMNAACRG